MSVHRRGLSGGALAGLMILLASCSNTNGVAEPAVLPGVTVKIDSGTYTLTITAGDAAGLCAPTFPPAARRRVYTARVEEMYVSGTHRLEVFLSGADLAGRAFFFGTARATGEIHFRIQDAWPGDQWWPFPSDPDVVERLSDGTQLVVVGDISARRAGNTISGQGGVLNHSSGAQCAIERFEMVRL